MPFTNQGFSTAQEVQTLQRVAQIRLELLNSWKEKGVSLEVDLTTIEAYYRFFSEYPAWEQGNKPVTITVLDREGKNIREIALGKLRQETGYYQTSNRDRAIMQMINSTYTTQTVDYEAFLQTNSLILRKAREIN